MKKYLLIVTSPYGSPDVYPFQSASSISSLEAQENSVADMLGAIYTIDDTLYIVEVKKEFVKIVL